MEKSRVAKRTLKVSGRNTSVSLEEAFWNRLREIADERDVTLSTLVGQIDADRQFANLSSAIRLFVLDAYRKQISELAGTSSVASRQKGARWAAAYARSCARHGTARSPSQAALRSHCPG